MIRRMIDRYVLLLCLCVLLGSSMVNAQDDTVVNADFEQVDNTGHLTGWMTYAWGKADPKTVQSGQRGKAGVEGSSCAWLAAITDTGAQGLVSSRLKVTRAMPVLQVTVMIKPDTDYAGHQPWVFLAWSDEQGKFLSTTTLGNVQQQADGWQMYGIALDNAKIPENAGYFTVNLASSAQKGKQGAGVLLFDQVRVTWQETSTLPMKQAVKPAVDPWMHANWIVPQAYAAWFTFGKPVTYTVERSQLPAQLQTLRGNVTDTQGNTVATVEVSRKDLLENGWSWTPSQPGHYRLQFEVQTSTQNAWQPLSRTYAMRAPTGKTQDFAIDTWELAVPAVANLPVAQRSRQYGVSLGYDDGRGAKLAELMGMQFVRFHGIGWGASFSNETMGIELKPGEYDWSHLDRQMAQYRKLGFEVVGNVLYTPRWASPHPEDDKVYICVRGYSAYAPKDINTWTNFLTQVVRRYGSEIRTWELWNEPNIPGGSVFWKDTPENFLMLMREGYKTIKALQPDAEIWIGGLGPRSSYFTFYDRYLQGEGGDYFDTLAVHGSWATPHMFNLLDAKHGVKPKPWVNSEWHAVLYQTTAGEDAVVMPSEVQITRRMMLDLMQQLRGRVERIALFIPIGIVDREVMPFARENRWIVHFSGMFRTRPVQEPRLCAVVLQHLFAGVSDKLDYGGASSIDQQHVAWFTHGNKQLALLWSDSQEDQASDAAFSAILQSASRITTWDGRPMALAQGRVPIAAQTMLLLHDVDVAALHKLSQDEQAVSNPRLKSYQFVETSKGSFVPGKLFDSVDAVDTSKVTWQGSLDYVTLDGRSKPAGLDARFAVGVTPEDMYLLVEVTDKQHVAQAANKEYWQGDSVQFAIDPDGTAQPGNQLECIMSMDRGKALLVKNLTPWLGGDLPDRFTPRGQPVEHAQIAIKQIDAQTWLYALRLSASEVYPFLLNGGKSLRFSLLINNNDGAGRSGYLQWAAGIGAEKNPAVYGTLRPQ